MEQQPDGASREISAPHLVVPGIVASVLAGPALGVVRVVSIDGPAGSGKTTLAAALSEVLIGRGLTVALVHMDDLYAGWDQDLSALGSDITGWLLDPLSRGRAGSHPVYDWAADEFGPAREVGPADVVILEGVGSGSHAIRAVAACSIWVEAHSDLRLARGLARDGEHMRTRWIEWRRREEAHFAADGTRAGADIALGTDPQSTTSAEALAYVPIGGWLGS